MQLDLFNIDEFCDSLQPITEPKIFSKNSSLYTTGGLFSQTIFGPVRTATCSCPGHVYWGRDRIGETCPSCNVDITYASERRKRFAKIELPFPVFNPIMYHLLVKAGKNRLRDIIDKMLEDPKNGFYYDDKKKTFVSSDLLDVTDDDYDDIAIYTGIEGLHDIVEIYCTLYKEDDDLWEFISDNMDKFYISNIIVIPPEFRPVSRDEQKKDEINDIYLLILNFSLTLQDDNLGTDTLVGIKHTTFKYLQTHVFALYEYIFSKLSKKRGLIRGSILGRRVDYSGRAVISPDPSLKLGECSLPYLMVLEIWKLDIANVLIERRQFNRYDAAIDYIDECIELENLELLDICKKVLEDEYVVLNRQPTLHRLGELAFKPRVNDGCTIKIHPFVCGMYNADFDGDMMAVYRPLYPNCREELKEKMTVASNLVCQTTGGMTLGVNQDVLLGLYMLTKDDGTPKIELEDGTSTFEGRVVFNKCLPESLPVFFNQTVNKKVLSVVFNELLHGCEPEEVIDAMDKIKDVGLRYTTMIGTTMSLKDLGGFNAGELTDPIFDSDDDIGQKLARLQSTEIMDKVKDSFPYSTFIDSGSRGSWDQANQIIVCRGFVSNFKGQVITTPIRNNLMTGLTRREFLASCYGARKGLLDVAINTSVSGHLNRKMVYCECNLEVDMNNDDCGTNDRLRVVVPAKGEDPGIDSLSLAGSMCGRWAIIEGEKDEFLIDYTNYHKVVGKTVLLRSPIYCRSFNLCKKCYGTHCDRIHSKYVGIIAGQALGEVSTQLVMRTFHTAGVVTSVTDSDETQDIVNDLSLAKKLLHNSTPIEYRGQTLTKLTHNDILMHLFEIYSRHKRILLVHYECILSQMMRVGDIRWRLTESRDMTQCEIVSIESVPARESWLLALAFSKPRQYLIDGVLSSKVNSAGLLEKIMMNESF